MIKFVDDYDDYVDDDEDYNDSVIEDDVVTEDDNCDNSHDK